MSQNLRLAIVVSEFNKEITDKLLSGALEQLATHQVVGEAIDVFSVPGAVEIPLTAKLLAAQKKYHAIISLGCVIQGDTDHYDYVCQQVSFGCQEVMMRHEVPVIFGVLTTQDFNQALERVGGNAGHKGKEAADAAIHMAKLVASIHALAQE